MGNDAPRQAGAQLRRSTIATYAAGSIGTGGFATLPGLVLTYYLTDSLGVAALLAAAGLIESGGLVQLFIIVAFCVVAALGMGAHVEGDDHRARSVGENDVRLGDAADARLEHLHADFVGGEALERLGDRFDRALHVCLDDHGQAIGLAVVGDKNLRITTAAQPLAYFVAAIYQAVVQFQFRHRQRN